MSRIQRYAYADRSLSFQRLEPRHLLTTTICSPPDLDVVHSQAVRAAEVSIDRTTPFGVPVELESLEGTQAVHGALSVTNPVDVFLLSPSDRTDVVVTSEGDSDVQFYVAAESGQSVNFGVGLQSVDGRLAATLEDETYFLYVFDFSGSRGAYELEIRVPDPPPRIEEFPEVPYIGQAFDWNLNSVNAPEVWSQGFTGEGTLVAVLDTGVDYQHPDLDDNIWTNPGEVAGDGIDNDGNGFVDDIHGWDFAYRDNNPMDYNGHGTHVAGTIAAERNGIGTTGIAYDATILPVKVLNNSGSGSFTAIARGIRYAVDAGADVINLSLGGGLTRTVMNAIEHAWENDVLVVAASGNDSASRPGAPAILSSILPNTLSVGSHDQRDNRSSFSNQVGDSRSVQIDAPGSRVASTHLNDGYRYLNGTSMATPHVAGVAALAVSANDEISAVELRELLTVGASRTVSRSDSIGGVDAARTVARAFQFDAFQRASDPRPAIVDAVFASRTRPTVH